MSVFSASLKGSKPALTWALVVTAAVLPVRGSAQEAPPPPAPLQSAAPTTPPAAAPPKDVPQADTTTEPQTPATASKRTAASAPAKVPARRPPEVKNAPKPTSRVPAATRDLTFDDVHWTAWTGAGLTAGAVVLGAGTITTLVIGGVLAADIGQAKRGGDPSANLEGTRRVVDIVTAGLALSTVATLTAGAVVGGIGLSLLEEARVTPQTRAPIPANAGSEPTATEPAATEPAATEPAATEPATEPATTEPATEPAATEPAATEPAATEPATEPAATEPATEPATAPLRVIGLSKDTNPKAPGEPSSETAQSPTP